MQVFGTDLGEHYEKQDRTVLVRGRSLVNLLELHMYDTRHVGWCLTTKLPLYDKRNSIIGLVGVSQDLKMPDVSSEDFQRIAAAIDVAQEICPRQPPSPAWRRRPTCRPISSIGG